MKKVTQMPGTLPKLTPTEAQAAIADMMGMLPVQLDYIKIQAKLRKGKYDALLAEGFTEDQALEIVKSTPPIE